MIKGYIVKEVYRHYGESTLGFCPTIELARMLKQRSENLYDLKDSEITSTIWEKMIDAYEKNPDNALRPLTEVLFELFPEYPITDIEKACNYYENREYLYTYVEGVDIFANESDIILYGTNS